MITGTNFVQIKELTNDKGGVVTNTENLLSEMDRYIHPCISKTPPAMPRIIVLPPTNTKQHIHLRNEINDINLGSSKKDIVQIVINIHRAHPPNI